MTSFSVARLLSATAAALLLGTAPAAMAAQDAASAPEAISVHLRPDAVGDRRVYESRTTLEVREGPSAGTQTNRQVFELETREVRPDGLVLRYTIREASLEDSRVPDLESFLKAWTGVPIEFEAGSAGEPGRILNWPAARQAYSQALVAQGVAAPARQSALSDLDDLGEGGRTAQILGDVALLAAMQPRTPIFAGRFVPPAPAATDVAAGAPTVSRVLEISTPGSARCLVDLLQSTEVAAPATQAGEATRTTIRITASVAVEDGWVSVLARSLDSASGQNVARETVTITRDPQPECAR
jgi:hypothetical protein